MHRRRKGMFAGTGRYTGFRHACIYLISYLSHSVYLERILPGRFSSRLDKAGQFLSYKTPLCRNDIMLTLERFFGPLSCHVMSCDAITNIASKCVILKTNFKHHEEKTADCRQ